MLWVPSFIALMFARRVIGGGAFARGFGGWRALHAHRRRARPALRLPAARSALAGWSRN